MNKRQFRYALEELKLLSVPTGTILHTPLDPDQDYELVRYEINKENISVIVKRGKTTERWTMDQVRICVSYQNLPKEMKGGK